MATFRLLAALDSPAPSTLDSLIAAVADHPADPAYRLVLADWCEENGDQIAADCWRWTATANVHPEPQNDGGERSWWRWMGRRYGWSGPMYLPCSLADCLPASNVDRIKSGNYCYSSPDVAWFAMLSAWRACVAAGINPTE